jgi:hypothetical protein
MKHRKNELDVDFIGGQEPLTAEEKKALNDYFRTQKAKAGKVHHVLKKRSAKRKKSLA